MGLHMRPGDTQALGFYTAYFGQLIGATIIGFAMVPEEQDPEFPEYEGDFWPTFLVRLKDGSEVAIELSQDEEGNGPGWCFGLPIPGR
jgi:hypothetical protein